MNETEPSPANPALDLFRECIPYFEVLADENRQRLVLALAEGHETLNVGALTERVSLSRPAVSHHLKVLLQAGMVGFTRKGTENCYFLTVEPMVRKLKAFVVTAEQTCRPR
jgi:DNA-binding transcriptional ArsR family regulator